MKLRNIGLAAVGLLLASSSLAHASPASLTINLRFADGTNTYDLTSDDVGHDVEIDVWASINGYNAPSANNLFAFHYVYYGIASSLPDGAGTAAGGELTTAVTPDGNMSAVVSPFNANGAQVGSLNDFNGDGVADLGPALNSSEAYNAYALIRAGGFPWSDYNLPTENLLPTGCEFEVEKLFYHVDSLSGDETDFEPVSVSLGPPYVSSMWAYDVPASVAHAQGSLSARYIQTSPALAGTGVELVVSPDALLATSAVPEPTTAGLILGVGLVPLLRRRKRLLSRNPKLCN